MARSGKKDGNNATASATDPEAEERTRLKNLAFSRGIISRNPVRVGPAAALGPSKTTIKHHGKDIMRKSQRKNRYLFSFPGLLGPISGGKIGELNALSTKNPILYLDLPQGQMKLFGTIIYPKNRYLTLQFSKGGKNVTCDDYFDNMIVFSDAWWIGSKEENPEELKLDFPKELNLEKPAEVDFKGGVGSTYERKQVSEKFSVKCMEQDSPLVDVEDDLTDSSTEFRELKEVAVTPTRHSARTAGKTFKFAEASSGDDITGNEVETPEDDDEKVDNRGWNYTPIEPESSSPRIFATASEDMGGHNLTSGRNKRIAKAKDSDDKGDRSLVQTTLSTLFKKVEEKHFLQKEVKEGKQKTNNSEISKTTKGRKKKEENKTGGVAKEQNKQVKLKNKPSGASSMGKRQVDLLPASESSDPYNSSQLEDDIEEFSSTSHDMDASDEDWTS